jgi:hypothetical protein
MSTRGGRGKTRPGARIDSTAVSRERLDFLIDHKDFLLKYQDHIEKLMSGKIDVPQFLKIISPDMMVRLGQLALTAKNEKTKLTAMQDILDRAGYSKVEKHAIANIDPSIPQEQLIAMLEGIGKKTGTIDVED